MKLFEELRSFRSEFRGGSIVCVRALTYTRSGHDNWRKETVTQKKGYFRKLVEEESTFFD